MSILYSKNLDLKVKRLPLGDYRINAVQVLSSHFFMYATYTHQAEGDKEGESYRNCLDQLSEVLSTYGKTHAVLILGDLNASLLTRTGNRHDSLLKQFVETNGLPCKQRGENTLFHPNKYDKAEIDYIYLMI